MSDGSAPGGPFTPMPFRRVRSAGLLLRGIAEHAYARALKLKVAGLERSKLGRAIVDALMLPADVANIRTQYGHTFGRPPHLLAPRTFNEKLQHAKLFRRQSRHTTWADKVAVRDYVATTIGPQYLTKLLWTGTDLRAAQTTSLPDRFVIKANQGSGTNLFVQDARTFDWDVAVAQTQDWLEHDHSLSCAEWQYRWIPPTLLIEEYLHSEHGQGLIDYKFFCFHGVVTLIQVDFDRFTEHTRSFYDRDFGLLPVGLEFPRQDGRARRPSCYDEMIRVAEALAVDEPFIRVDLYDIGRPIFGELTLHPEAGLGRFDPPEWDARLGALM